MKAGAPLKKNNSDQPETEEKVRITKPVIILIIILLLIPTLFSFYSISVQEKIKIGIVLTNDQLYPDAEIARDSLNQFEDVFDAQILDIKFNESNVRIKDKKYLTDDYFDADFAAKVRNDHNVDIVMILTNRTINNWRGDRKALWGQADTKNAMILVTTFYIQNNESLHEQYIKSTTIHETLHILGYIHPYSSQDCVMQYATYETELCFESKLELPFHTALWRLGTGHEFRQAAFLINLSINIIISTLFIALMIIIQFLFKRFMYKQNKIDQKPLIFGIGALFIGILLISPFIGVFFSRIAYMFSATFIYVILEAVAFERKTKYA